MPIELETERLFLRPMNEGDVDAVFALRRDAEMMRFIRQPQTKRSEAANWVRLVSSRWQSDRYGFCAVIEKSSGTFVGWCGLWELKESGEIEVGYAITKEFWKQGLASEAAARFLEYGFTELKLEKIVAVANPENAASRRVMEKIGMSFDDIGRFYGLDLAHYSISRSVWETARSV